MGPVGLGPWAPGPRPLLAVGGVSAVGFSLNTAVSLGAAALGPTDRSKPDEQKQESRAAAEDQSDFY